MLHGLSIGTLVGYLSCHTQKGMATLQLKTLAIHS